MDLLKGLIAVSSHFRQILLESLDQEGMGKFIDEDMTRIGMEVAVRKAEAKDAALQTRWQAALELSLHFAQGKGRTSEGDRG